MNTVSNIFLQVHKLLEQKQRFVLASIVKQIGSSPRKVGAKCIILEDGNLIGSIGGGSLEFDVLKNAKDIFVTGKSKEYHYQFSGESSDNIEMVCGGMSDVYLEPMFPEHEETRMIFGRIHKMLTEGIQGLLLTQVSAGLTGDNGCRILFDDDGTSYGNIAGVDVSRKDFKTLKNNSLQRLAGNNISVYVESIDLDDTLFLFGGGHVAFYLAPIVKKIGFHLVVIDDRNEFVTRDRFPDADKIKNVSFSDINEHIEITNNSYLVILTHNHVNDRAVLGQVLDSNAAYIGMIASKRKRKVVYESLLEEGCSKSLLKQVKSPVGLDIKAETPQEIAISIAAELIYVRALKREKNL